MNIRPVLLIGLLFVLAIGIGCNSTKNAQKSNINDLYNIWQIDSVQLAGNIIPNSYLIGGVLEFSKDGNQTITIDEKVENIRFEVKDWKLINLDKPDEVPLTISMLTKKKMVFEGDGDDGSNKIRMVLTPLKK